MNLSIQLSKSKSWLETSKNPENLISRNSDVISEVQVVWKGEYSLKGISHNCVNDGKKAAKISGRDV